MNMKWLGHSCFLFTAKDGRTLLMDPFDATLGYPTPGEMANVVTCSHKHAAHHAIDVLPAGFTMIDQPGVHHARGLVVEGIASFHDDASGTLRGGNLIYVAELDGLRIAHLGDLGHQLSESQMEKLENIDILLIPVGGGLTIDGDGAAQVVRAINPRIAVPMHYKTHGFDADRIDITDEHPFVDQFAHEYLGANELDVTSERLSSLSPVVVFDAAAPKNH